MTDTDKLAEIRGKYRGQVSGTGSPRQQEVLFLLTLIEQLQAENERFKRDGVLPAPKGGQYGTSDKWRAP